MTVKLPEAEKQKIEEKVELQLNELAKESYRRRMLEKKLGISSMWSYAFLYWLLILGVAFIYYWRNLPTEFYVHSPRTWTVTGTWTVTEKWTVAKKWFYSFSRVSSKAVTLYPIYAIALGWFSRWVQMRKYYEKESKRSPVEVNQG